MDLTVGDGIAFAALIWLLTWLLSKAWPAVFGGGVEEWLALRTQELERKAERIAKAKHDEMERRRAAKLHQQNERWPSDNDVRVDHRSNVGRAHVIEDGAFAGSLHKKKE